MDFSQSYSQLQQSGFVVKQLNDGFESHGIYKGYSILSLITTGKNKNNATIIFTLETNMIKRGVLKQIKQAIGSAAVVLDNFKIKITTTVCTDATNEIMTVIDKIAECLAANNIKTRSNCYVCGRTGCDCAVIDDSSYTAAHVECVKYRITHDTKTATKMSNGNIFTGIIGAILGSIVGAIPTILTIGLTNTIYGLLCVLVPMCAYWGYKLFKGKVNRATVWIIAVISILQSFVISVFSIWIFSEFTYSPLYCALYLIAYPGEFAEMISKTLIFVGIGIFAAWSYIKKRPVDYVVSAQVAKESALYYDFGGNGVSPHMSAPVSDSQQDLPAEMQDSNV